MKHFSTICALAALSAPLIAHAAPFEAAAQTWNEVRAEVAYLDKIVAEKKLAEVHDTAFNIAAR